MNTKVFQEQVKPFGNKKVESIVGLQIQGTRAMSKCSAVSVFDSLQLHFLPAYARGSYLMWKNLKR